MNTPIPADLVAAVEAAEDNYQSLREALTAAKDHRLAVIYTAVTATDAITVKATSPVTVTAATIRAAIQRCAPAETGWHQPELFTEPDDPPA